MRLVQDVVDAPGWQGARRAQAGACNRRATQSQIVRAFGVPLRTVKRYCKLYKEKGPQGFYEPRVSRGPAVLVPDVMSKAQELLDADQEIKQVSVQVGVKVNTLQKAVRAGRLHVREKKVRRTGRATKA